MGSYDEILDQVPVDQLAGQLGVGSDEVRQAAEHALPALLGGLQATPRTRREPTRCSQHCRTTRGPSTAWVTSTSRMVAPSSATSSVATPTRWSTSSVA